MAMDMLRRLAASPLPANFHTAEEIDKVELLRAAGLVIALSPADVSGSGGLGDSARVLAITAKGREELARFELPTQTVTESPAANSWKSRLGSDFLTRLSQ